MWSDFQYGFRSSQSTADLLTVVSDRIARAFNRSGATRAVAIDISNAFDRVWHAGLLHKLKSYGISGQIFGLISSFLSNRRLRVVLDGKSSQEYLVMREFLKAPFLVLHFSYYTLMVFLMLSVILLSMLMILLSVLSVIGHLICGNNLNWILNFITLCSKCDRASDLWQQLELDSELESDLRDTVDWSKKWLVDFNAVFLRKNHLLIC